MIKSSYHFFLIYQTISSQSEKNIMTDTSEGRASELNHEQRVQQLNDVGHNNFKSRFHI